MQMQKKGKKFDKFSGKDDLLAYFMASAQRISYRRQSKNFAKKKFSLCVSSSQIPSPWWGDKVCSEIGLVRQPYAGVNFIPPVRDYEFGYWFRFRYRINRSFHPNGLSKGLGRLIKWNCKHFLEVQLNHFLYEINNSTSPSFTQKWNNSVAYRLCSIS